MLPRQRADLPARSANAKVPRKGLVMIERRRAQRARRRDNLPHAVPEIRSSSASLIEVRSGHCQGREGQDGWDNYPECCAVDALFLKAEMLRAEAEENFHCACDGVEAFNLTACVWLAGPASTTGFGSQRFGIEFDVRLLTPASLS